MTFKKKMLILGCLAVVAAAGVGTSVAFLNDAADVTGTLQAAAGIVISWGEDSTLGDIETLTPGTPQYQSVIIDWEKSASVTSGTITTTFTLDTTSGDLSIGVSNTSLSVSGASVDATLTSANTTHSYTIDLNTETATTATYYLQYLYTGASGDTSGASGTLTVAVEYNAD